MPWMITNKNYENVERDRESQENNNEEEKVVEKVNLVDDEGNTAPNEVSNIDINKLFIFGTILENGNFTVSEKDAKRIAVHYGPMRIKREKQIQEKKKQK